MAGNRRPAGLSAVAVAALADAGREPGERDDGATGRVEFATGGGR